MLHFNKFQMKMKNKVNEKNFSWKYSQSNEGDE